MTPATATPAGRPLRIAVAGLGAIARTAHLPLLERRRELFEITALCDLSPSALEELGARYGVPPEHRHTSTEALLADGGFDAVVLLTSGSHGPAAEAALRAGHAVLCEKPLAFTRAEVARIADAERAQRRGPRLMVGYMKQYDPATRRLAALLADAGGPSRVRSAEVCVLHPTGPDQLAFARLPAPGGDADPAELAALTARDDALTDAALGSAATPEMRSLYHIVIGSISHDLSLLRTAAGAPETVDLAAMWSASAAGPGSVELSGRLPGGARYAIRWHFLPGHAAYRETFAVHHESGSLELAFPSPYLMNAPTVLTETSTAPGEGPHTERRAEHRSVTEAFEEELAAFHTMVTEGTPPLTGTEGALADLTTAQCAVAAYAAHHRLPCEGEAATA
ncbi:Gfo/Idh/MocA family protein [Streptomyces sp. NPDC007025]|uniref:Gfo/Idh/MocA family protein n=1 Tax=Streptomyces sp. NPDC007025 TaxID=3364771 RepID=UPI00367CEFBA